MGDHLVFRDFLPKVEDPPIVAIDIHDCGPVTLSIESGSIQQTLLEGISHEGKSAVHKITQQRLGRGEPTQEAHGNGDSQRSTGEEVRRFHCDSKLRHLDTVFPAGSC